MGENFDCHGGESATEVYLQHDWNHDNSVTATIMEGLMEVTDTSLTDLNPPLYEVVDPDALETLCQPLDDERLRDGSGQLTFPAYDCMVTLYWDGTIKIDPPDES